MTSEKDKAEAYVRSQIPELMAKTIGCRIRHKDQHKAFEGICIIGEAEDKHYVDQYGSHLPKDKYEIIGHPIQLQHWLRVLQELTVKNRLPRLDYVDCQRGAMSVALCKKAIRFNLTTGQPATEEDYKVFNSIVGI